ncbi:MAG: hypothetical protein VYB90_10515, partial [Actinomycetota bacterium]|nr:hypothetical protein [Actinomycetota bacterium]
MTAAWTAFARLRTYAAFGRLRTFAAFGRNDLRGTYRDPLLVMLV